MKSKLILTILVIVLFSTVAMSQQITGTKHDLSVTGTSNWTGIDPVNQVCIYCHTPHAASLTQKPLWNRAATAETFTPYSSTTFDGTSYFADPIGHQPQGDSKLCLSCHDGITALNAMLYSFGPPIQMVGGFDQLGDVYFPGTPFHNGMGPNIGEMYPGGPGTGNLANDHPVSFTFNNALITEDADGGPVQLQLPPANHAVKLVGATGNQMECSSCHDVHSDQFGAFLVMSNSGSAICLTCHIK